MNRTLALYLSGSDNVNEIGEASTEEHSSVLINNSLSLRERNEPLEDSIKRRIILNPFTEEEVRNRLILSSDESFMSSLAAEAFKTRHIKHSLDRLKEATKSILDWNSLESHCLSNHLETFKKLIPPTAATQATEIMNKISSI